jgi:hypothetical protein
MPDLPSSLNSTANSVATAPAGPQATTRFSLRTAFVLMVICAIVAALFRHSTMGFLVFGMPILVHVVVSYSLHRWRSSGYICLLLGMLTSALGFLAYSWYESLQPDRRPVFQLPPAFLMVQAIGLGMFAGFVPVVLEFWLRLAFDGMMLVARGIKRLIRPAAETQPQPTSEK